MNVRFVLYITKSRCKVARGSPKLKQTGWPQEDCNEQSLDHYAILPKSVHHRRRRGKKMTLFGTMGIGQ